MGSKNGVLHLIRYMLDRHYDKKYFIDVFGEASLLVIMF